MIVRPAEIHVARLSSRDGLSPILRIAANARPRRQPRRPPPARIIGKSAVAVNTASPIFAKFATAIMIAADIVATKLSRRSEQLPAISFTLSPIKSATTFGTRLSSSGIS